MKAYRTERLYTEGQISLDDFMTDEPGVVMPSRIDLRLPEGCIGMQLVFKTKKALRAFAGKKAAMVEIGIGHKE